VFLLADRAAAAAAVYLSHGRGSVVCVDPGRSSGSAVFFPWTFGALRG